MQPWHADTNPGLKSGRAGAVSLHRADNLVARDNRLLQYGQLGFGHMEIGSTNAAGVNFDENFARAGLRNGNVGIGERVCLDRSPFV